MVISVLNYLSSQMTSVDTGDTDISYINHSELIPASVMWPTSHPATTRPDHVIYISLCVTQKGAGSSRLECFVRKTHIHTGSAVKTRSCAAAQIKKSSHMCKLFLYQRFDLYEQHVLYI